MSEEDDTVGEVLEDEPEAPEESEEYLEEADLEEGSQEMLQVVSGPFAVLIQTLDFLNTAWDHAVGKDDFEKMMMVVDKTLDVNDRYMAIHMTQEDNNERVDPQHPEQFGFSAEIADRDRPPDVKSRRL